MVAEACYRRGVGEASPHPRESAGETPQAPAYRRRRARGQALAEFGVVCMTAVFLLLAVTDVARALYQAMAVRQAAQAGALVALNWQAITSQCPNICATQQVYNAIKQAPSGITIVDADISLTPASAWSDDPAIGWRPGQEFTITVTHQFDFIAPFLRANSLNLATSITATRNP